MFEGSTRNTSSMAIKMLSRAAVKGGDGQCLRAQLPYIRSDLPILVVFRALGFVVSSLLPCCCRILINGLHQTVDTGLVEPMLRRQHPAEPGRMLRVVWRLPCEHQGSPLDPVRSDNAHVQQYAALHCPLLSDVPQPTTQQCWSVTAKGVSTAHLL